MTTGRAVLSGQQQRVVRMIAEGLTNRQIAGALFVSDTTAKTHVKTVMEKLGARNRANVVYRAYRAGLIE